MWISLIPLTLVFQASAQQPGYEYGNIDGSDVTSNNNLAYGTGNSGYNTGTSYGNTGSSTTDSNGQTGMRLEDSIPGIPAVDYPIFPFVPPTKFTCDGKLPGYYADTETGCQAFHICYDDRMASFLCPNGTTFHQQFFVCDWWFNSDCSQAENFYSVNANLFVTTGHSSWSPTEFGVPVTAEYTSSQAGYNSGSSYGQTTSNAQPSKVTGTAYNSGQQSSYGQSVVQTTNFVQQTSTATPIRPIVQQNVQQLQTVIQVPQQNSFNGNTNQVVQSQQQGYGQNVQQQVQPQQNVQQRLQPQQNVQQLKQTTTTSNQAVRQGNTQANIQKNNNRQQNTGSAWNNLQQQNAGRAQQQNVVNQQQVNTVTAVNQPRQNTAQQTNNYGQTYFSNQQQNFDNNFNNQRQNVDNNFGNQQQNVGNNFSNQQQQSVDSSFNNQQQGLTNNQNQLTQQQNPRYRKTTEPQLQKPYQMVDIEDENSNLLIENKNNGFFDGFGNQQTDLANPQFETGEAVMVFDVVQDETEVTETPVELTTQEIITEPQPVQEEQESFVLSQDETSFKDLDNNFIEQQESELMDFVETEIVTEPSKPLTVAPSRTIATTTAATTIVPNLKLNVQPVAQQLTVQNVAVKAVTAIKPVGKVANPVQQQQVVKITNKPLQQPQVGQANISTLQVNNQPQRIQAAGEQQTKTNFKASQQIYYSPKPVLQQTTTNAISSQFVQPVAAYQPLRPVQATKPVQQLTRPVYQSHQQPIQQPRPAAQSVPLKPQKPNTQQQSVSWPQTYYSNAPAQPQQVPKQVQPQQAQRQVQPQQAQRQVQPQQVINQLQQNQRQVQPQKAPIVVQPFTAQRPGQYTTPTMPSTYARAQQLPVALKARPVQKQQVFQSVQPNPVQQAQRQQQQPQPSLQQTIQSSYAQFQPKSLGTTLQHSPAAQQQSTTQYFTGSQSSSFGQRIPQQAGREYQTSPVVNDGRIFIRKTLQIREAIEEQNEQEVKPYAELPELDEQSDIVDHDEQNYIVEQLDNNVSLMVTTYRPNSAMNILHTFAQVEESELKDTFADTNDDSNSDSSVSIITHILPANTLQRYWKGFQTRR